MLNSLKTMRQFTVANISYDYFSLPVLATQLGVDLTQLPYSLKVLLENLLRHEDGKTVTLATIKALASCVTLKPTDSEINYHPARVLMQDFTGVPAIVDLAAMRDAMQQLGGNPELINPLISVDLVVDHSIQVDNFATTTALHRNSNLEMQRNHERYALLRWGQQAFNNFRVVPPATGICHQVNLEYLATVVCCDVSNKQRLVYPDTVIGTDSHTTMINGLGVLGWGVGGIEAEAAMLGQPLSMLIPEVIGVKLYGELSEGVTATDLVLTLTELLRHKGVVGRFVEYCGPGLNHLSVADRATLANMAPEYGATCGFFPIDQLTLDYLSLSGRDANNIELVKLYSQLQGLWRDQDTPIPIFTDLVELDLSTIKACIAGPKRPQDRLLLPAIKSASRDLLALSKREPELERVFYTEQGQELRHADVVIAAITSCTNTSNPNVMVAAGLVAKKAVAKGLHVKPWVKTSLAPGSQVVTRYLEATGLQEYLNNLGFFTVGYGCTTCIGNSGPLAADIADTISEHNLIVAAVLSGNRNFEGRVHPQVRANWLASPPLVVIFALTGTTNIDLSKEPVGQDQAGNKVFLADLWPSTQEIATEVAKISRVFFKEQYANVFAGSDKWQNIAINPRNTYLWQDDSTYIQQPPYFKTKLQNSNTSNIEKAAILAIFGDSITTDHISPAGAISATSPAGQYLLAQGITTAEFNSYGARRGNHEVMMRGTFANPRIKNALLPDIEGGFTKHFPSNEILPIYDAAIRYQKEQKNLIIIAGKEYGTGSSRDWAAKGPMLLGVKAVIATSFERIHRSNLIGMGILPLQFLNGMSAQTLALLGNELIDVILQDSTVGAQINAIINYANGTTKTIALLSRIDTQKEQAYYLHGGILQYVLQTKFATLND